MPNMANFFAGGGLDVKDNAILDCSSGPDFYLAQSRIRIIGFQLRVSALIQSEPESASLLIGPTQAGYGIPILIINKNK